jgi:hypothetical protein
MNLTVSTSRIITPLALIAALNACSLTGSNTFTGTAQGYDFSSLNGSTASGTIKIAQLSDGSIATTLNLTGLTPATRYTANYRAKDGEACAPRGEITTSFGSFTADALGNATVGLLSPPSSLTGEAIDVRNHSAPERSLMCADLEEPGTALNDLTGAIREEAFAVRVGSTARGMVRIVALSDGMTAATVSLTGLQPNTVYAAQFRALGTVSDLSCLSRGVATAQFPAFSSDDSGNGSARLLTPSVRITGVRGAYIEVQPTSSLSRPLCANLKGIPSTAVQGRTWTP